MSYLSYVSDEFLIKEIKFIIDKSISKNKSAQKDFNKNVIDPFGALFEAPSFKTHEEWKNSEIARQSQKTIQNHIGNFHQKILGEVAGWDDLGTGSVIDLRCEERKIIAEIKNKYNTVTGGKLADQYRSLEGLIAPKHSRFKDYTAYFVNIIPKRPMRINEPFTPSDKDKGERCPVNEKIRIIDGASFYALATGEDNALEALHLVMPEVIEEILRSSYNKKNYVIPDKESFMEYFKLAYKNNHV